VRVLGTLTYTFKYYIQIFGKLHIKKITLFTKIKFIILHLQEESIIVYNVRG